MIDNTNQTQTKSEGLNKKTDIPDNITPPTLRRQNTRMYDISSNFISGLQPPILRRQNTTMYDVSSNFISSLQSPILCRQKNIVQEHHLDHKNTDNELMNILDEYNHKNES